MGKWGKGEWLDDRVRMFYPEASLCLGRATESRLYVWEGLSAGSGGHWGKVGQSSQSGKGETLNLSLVNKHFVLIDKWD